MSNEKAMIIHLIVASTKKTLRKMTKYFSEQYKHFGRVKMNLLVLKWIYLIMQKKLFKKC